MVVTLLYVGALIAFNAVVGTNYGYLNGKPAGGSALDLLGPWPTYVVMEVLIVAAVWALMTWPWAAGQQSRGPRSTGARSVSGAA